MVKKKKEFICADDYNNVKKVYKSVFMSNDSTPQQHILAFTLGCMMAAWIPVINISQHPMTVYTKDCRDMQGYF